jgi:hypothetical protein
MHSRWTDGNIPENGQQGANTCLHIGMNQSTWDAFWHRKWAFEIRYIQLFSSCMELEQRATIKYLHFKKMKIAEIHRKLRSCLTENAYAPASFRHWAHEFRIGRVSREDAPPPKPRRWIMLTRQS